MGTFNPEIAPVDYILLAGEISPGLVVISGANSPRRWDERRGYALSGARVVYRGIGLARPILTFRLLSFEDWNDWHEWTDRVGLQREPVGERARAKDIWHPILEDLGIVSVVIEDVGQPVQADDGEWHIVVKTIEYRRPVRRIEDVGSSEETPALSENQRRIRDLSAQFNRLAAE